MSEVTTRLRFWTVVLSVAMVAAFAAASYSVWNASHTADDTRAALCQVLLFVRQSSLDREPGLPPLTEQQREQITLFYQQLIALVKDCEIPIE